GLDAGVELDGVFVANNLMTIGVLEALALRGLSVPDDIQLIGYDDLPWAGGLAGEISIVIQPTDEIGHEAVRLLSERSEGYQGPPRQVVLRPQVHRAAQVREALTSS